MRILFQFIHRVEPKIICPPHPSVSPQHMHEAAGLKQQLQTEHEQALVALHTKQKEINQLQKVWSKFERILLILQAYPPPPLGY